MRWNLHDDFMALMLIAVGAPGFWELIKMGLNRLFGGSSVKQDIHAIKHELGEIKSDLMAEADQRREDGARIARGKILRFNDELLNGMRHSKSMFDTVLIDCTDYEKYCNEHPNFRNGLATEAIENIKRQYRICEQERDFL